MTKPLLWSLGPMVLEQTACWTPAMDKWVAQYQHPAPPDDARPRLRIVEQTYGQDPEQQQHQVQDLDVRVDDEQVTIRAADVFEAQCHRKTLDARIHLEEFKNTPLISLINPLRGMVTALLPLEFDGLMFHASSAVKAGRGLLFAGVSGQGKTTLSTSLTQAQYISDDISLVAQLSTDAPRVLPSPFFGSAGKLGHEVGGTFAGLALLEQSTNGQTWIEDLPGREAVAQVMRHVVCFSHDVTLQQALLDRVMDLVAGVKVVRLWRALETPADEVFEQVLAHVENRAR